MTIASAIAATKSTAKICPGTPCGVSIESSDAITSSPVRCTAAVVSMISTHHTTRPTISHTIALRPRSRSSASGRGPVRLSHIAHGAPRQPSRQVIRIANGCRKLSNSDAITA